MKREGYNLKEDENYSPFEKQISKQTL